jgi:hypothetical protein
MTQSSAHQARIHLIAEGVVASYIHDISVRTSLGAPGDAASPGQSRRQATAARSGVWSTILAKRRTAS